MFNFFKGGLLKKNFGNPCLLYVLIQHKFLIKIFFYTNLNSKKLGLAIKFFFLWVSVS